MYCTLHNELTFMLEGGSDGGVVTVTAFQHL